MNKSIETLLDLCRQKGMGNHPFLQTMSRKPPNLGMLYDFLANLAVTTSAYTGWVSSLSLRMDNVKIRSILFKLLNDEYGGGDPDQIHVNLMDKSLEVLRQWRQPGDHEAQLQPGREFRERTAKIFDAEHPYEGLGVVMAGEIFADQMIRWFGAELQRQDEVKPSELTWYGAHADIEADHAQDSSRLGKLIGDDPAKLEAVWRGAEAAIASQNAFLDTLMQRHFPALAA